MNEIDKHQAVLDRFLADNPELEQLTAQLATFNVFRALKIERVEIRHSNTLGWLLDPAESHGLRDVFLRRILSNMLLESDADIEGLTAAQVELMDFRDIEVRREWRHIDVLVIDRGNKLVVLIENKIGGGEQPGQLAGYRKVVSKEFPSFKVLPVFLTVDGQSSEDEEAVDYVGYSHAQLLAVLEGIVGQRSSQMPEAVAIFLRQYIDTLRRLTMQDEQLVSLCKAIYRRHREAIDLIVEYGATSMFRDIATDIIGVNGGNEVLRSTSRIVWFLPPSWGKVVPENTTAWHHLTRPVSVCCWMDQQPNRARLIFEVSRMDDPDLRMACVEALRDAGFKLTKMAFNKDAKYSRFYTSSQTVSDWMDEDEIAATANKLYAKAEEQFPKVEAVLKEVFADKQ